MSYQRDLDSDIDRSYPISSGFGDPEDVEMEGTDQPRNVTLEPLAPLDNLVRHWMNERHCPDILPVQGELLGDILDHLRTQSNDVQALLSDPQEAEKQHLRIMLLQIDIERVKFIVRSYIRTRLFKIERYARFVTQNAEVQQRITTSERDYASRHANITDRHFYSSILQSLPESQAHLEDPPIFMPSMISEPDISKPVFVHALADCPPVRLPDEQTMEMKKGHISLVPYRVIEHLLLRGLVELV